MQEQPLSPSFAEQSGENSTGPALDLAAETESTSSTRVDHKPAETVSVIILNYNGLADTRTCLLSLAEVDFPSEQLEIVVVDNGSSDRSTEMLRSEFPHVRLIENEKNLGFAQAANQAATAAKGEYLAFLNNDMRVESGWLNALVEMAQPENGIVCVGSTIMNWDGTAIDFSGRPTDAFCLSYTPSELPPPSVPVPGKFELFASFGAAIIQTKAFQELGGFDPDFFLYQEDVDLGWRLWLKGYKTVLCPTSIVYHRGAATSSSLPHEVIFTLSQQHMLDSVFKNFEDDNLHQILPLVLYFLLERSPWNLGGKEAVKLAIEGFESDLASLVGKRKEIQKTRIRSDAEIFSVVDHPFSFLLSKPSYQQIQRTLNSHCPVDDFDTTNAEIVRSAVRDWLSAAHFEYEAQLASKWKEVPALHKQIIEQQKTIESLALEIKAAAQRAESLVDQVGERQRAVELLTAQSAERHKRVLALTDQLAEQQKALDVPVEQLAQKERALQTFAAQVSEQQRTIGLLSAKLEERETYRAQSALTRENALTPSPSERLDEAQEQSQKLALQLAETEQKYTAQLARHENALEVISAQLEMRQSQLDKITDSFAWRLLSRYGRLKYQYLLPLYRLLGLKPAQMNTSGGSAGGDGSAAKVTAVLEPEPTLIAPESILALEQAHHSVEEETSPAEEDILNANDFSIFHEGYAADLETTQLSKEDILARATEEWLPIRLRAAQGLIRLLNVNSTVRGVVVFPQTIGWDINLFQRPQQIALALARQNYLVLYHNADELDGRAEFQRIAERLYLCYVPFDLFGFLEAPIVFALHYNREHLRYFRNARVVYEMIDELEVFHDKPERLERNHSTLLKRASLVCVTADRLLEKVKPFRPDAILVPNGVDYEHFEPARKRSRQEVPIALRSLVDEGKRIIGYYGAHARWVDYELLRYAALKRPDLNFLLIGPDHDDTLRASHLTSIANVRWLGPRPYKDLPDYLHYFDVAIIPFVVDSITLSVSPLKLFEYLAAGKPVVTTDLPECRKYSQVLVAMDQDEFVSHLDKALRLTDDMTYRVAAMQTAQQNTWDVRVKTIMHALEAAQLNPNNSNFELADSEGTELIGLISEQLNEQKKTIASLMGQVAEKEENTRTIVQAWAGIEQAREEATRDRDRITNEKEEVVKNLNRITSSPAWRLLNYYGRVKYRYLLPLYHLLGQKPAAEAASENGLSKENMLQSVRAKIEEAEPGAEPGLAVPPPSAYDVVVFPIIDWAFRFQRPQQLAKQFAVDGHRVFYLNTKFHQGGVAAHALGIAERIFGVQIPGPAHLNLYRDEINKQVLNDLINAMDLFRRRNMIEEAVCIVQLPFWTPLALAAQQRWGWKIVYDCMDEHAGFTTNNSTMLQHEETLVAQSDLVVTTSRRLQDRLAPVSKRTLSLPNATDFDHFSQPGPLHPLSKLNGPIIGYYGAISDWFDVDMVRAAAEARPDWQFVLIGDTFGANVSSLKRLTNVHLTGEQPYSAIPSYLHQFDVAIIPFLLTPLTESTNPVKFYEYLSAGKPVVAVELRELEPYGDYFYPVRSNEEFVTQIEKALNEDGPEKIRARVELAKQNTWLDRYKALSASIAQLYGKAAIIIVSFKNREYLWLCLEHLWTKTLYPNYKVIVVDNGCEPDIIEYLKKSEAKNSQLKVILNGENLGFARANNIGIEAAGDSEFIVLLNDDTIVTRHWLTKLLRHLQDKPVGLIGPVTNNIGNEGRIDVDYQIVAYKDVEVMEEFAQARAREYAGRSFDIPMLAMYCVAMRKSTIDEIGLLDEQFGIGMFEDDDFSLRVRQAGYRIVCAEDVFVHHWGRASFDQIDKTAYYQLFDENRAKFEAKWHRKWSPHKPRRASGKTRKASGLELENETERFQWNDDAQLNLLVHEFQHYQDEYNSFPRKPTRNPYKFHLNNPTFDGTDALVLYCMIRHFRPNIIAVVDTGFSLSLAAQAAVLNGNTRVICVAPDSEDAVLTRGQPGLTGTISQNPPEDILDVVDQLKVGDILFFGPHFLEKIHEDINYPLLEVLPRLKPGVITHFHGIFMPQKFPKEWMLKSPESWGLQCGLQIFLSCNPRFEVVFGNSYMAATHNREMSEVFPKSPWVGGGSFWIRKVS
jgi:GT2 family glycosyltransferase/glycosyltransferase involved in cell wall biosynthesis